MPELFAQFQRPDADARPFVRWWWNGGRVTEAELSRELDVMKAAGIGGVEINTIGMPPGATPASLARFPAHTWLGPSWARLVKVAVQEAHARGMTVDLLVGSGWPLGGRFLTIDQQTQRVRLVKREVVGPAVLTLSREELAAPDPTRRARDEVPPARQELVFLRLLPAGALAGAFQPGVEALPPADQATLRLEIPPGPHTLYVGFREQGFTHVKLGAPGADGPVLDHFNADAVRHYLNELATKLGPALGGKLGKGLRALFIDSLELDHANWTGDLPAVFAQRRGYDLRPYLPFVLDADVASAESPFMRDVRRARHDFVRTLVELFEERFLATFVSFCEAQGVLARVQAYGRETHPLHGGMRVHLPEGETWLWHDEKNPARIRVESTVVNKYVSSAAHLTGKARVSFEAMTNAVPVFRETLADFKRGLDASLLAGLNHPILHGFNYTPPEAGFPGWVRFGSYLNERVPWWPAFRRFADYAARLGSVLRATKPEAQVAVLAPRADEWSRFGMLYQPFPETHFPWYQYALASALAHAGYGSDFVSERVLQDARIVEGRLTYGPQSYELIVVEHATSLEPDTAEVLVNFVARGGRVLFVGQPPVEAPGLRDAARQGARVSAALASLAAQRNGRVHVVEAPDESQGYPGLVRWVQRHMVATGIKSPVQLSEVSPQVAQIHHRDERHDLFFFANLDVDEAHSFEARFPAARGQPWRWDPETGLRQPYPHVREGRVLIHLAPQTSLLLVFQAEAPQGEFVAGTWPAPGDPPQGRSQTPLLGPWTVAFHPANQGAPFTRTFPTLIDLSQQPDPALAAFGGVAIYTTHVEGHHGSEELLLDLGAVHAVSELSVNGQRLGTRWYGRHRYALGTHLRPGPNTISVRVSTGLANLMKAKKDDPAAQRWAHWFAPLPTGLLGPVTLSRSEPAP